MPRSIRGSCGQRLRQEAILRSVRRTDQFLPCETNKKHRQRADRDGRCAHEKAGEKSQSLLNIRRKAPKEHRRTCGCLRQEAILKTARSHRPGFRLCETRSIEKELIETVASLTRRRVKSHQSLLKLDASAVKEHRRIAGLRQYVAMPGSIRGCKAAFGRRRFLEDCLFVQTSFGFARPIRSIAGQRAEDGRCAHEKAGEKSQSLLKLDARRRKNIGGRKAGFRRLQCPESIRTRCRRRHF